MSLSIAMPAAGRAGDRPLELVGVGDHEPVMVESRRPRARGPEQGEVAAAAGAAQRGEAVVTAARRGLRPTKPV